MSKFNVITLCGSTKFKKEFMEIQKKLTLEGNIVISVGLFGHSGDNEVWESMDEGTLTETKQMLDDMHKEKINMSNEIFVINVGGYIGESTTKEIVHALITNKNVRFLEPISDEKRLIIETFVNAMKREDIESGCRDATKEEIESVNHYIDNISKATGINFFD